MATNLRLRPDAAEAVRREAERTGRSQQDVIREAVDTLLNRAATGQTEDQVEAQVMSVALRPPRTAYRRPAKRLILPARMTSGDLLDRDDRF